MRMNLYLNMTILFSLLLCSLEPTEYISPRSVARKAKQMKESPYFLVICTDAAHFNYDDGLEFLKSWRKHPQGSRKDGTVGHAWIVLSGTLNGQAVFIEGGHSGERGVHSLTYMEEVDFLKKQGDPNPVRALFEPLKDGYFQKGRGCHFPSFAAKIDLTEEQFLMIISFIHPKRYPYKDYSLTGRQCASFAAQVAALAGVNINSEVTLKLPQTFNVGKEKIVLFQDPKFSEITFSTPDVVEQELIRLVLEGKLECALDWYYIPRAVKI